MQTPDDVRPWWADAPPPQQLDSIAYAVRAILARPEAELEPFREDIAEAADLLIPVIEAIEELDVLAREVGANRAGFPLVAFQEPPA